MKTATNILYAATALAVLLLVPANVSAQVDKRVVVTRDYRPSLDRAVKLPVVPDMSDTVKMRPEIEYGITPVMYAAGLSVREYRPATVTYWEFNRPSNFYVKLGAGYPVNTVADFYGSVHDVRKGYIMAYANHHGQFGNMKNYFDESRDALQSRVRAGLSGGLYCGSRVFEGDVSYYDAIGRRYAGHKDGKDLTAEYEDVNMALRFGDDFADLSRTNFNIGLSGTYFHDKSDWLKERTGGEKNNLQQFNAAFDARAARKFGRHYAELAAGYQGYWGIKTLSQYRNNIVRAGARYGYSWDLLDFTAGADYYYDRISSRSKASHHVIPYARLTFNIVQSGALIPFIELDGSLHNNSYYSLASRQIYVEFEDKDLRNTVDYNLRFGASGRFGRNRFGYRLYADMSFVENSLYWYNYDYIWLRTCTARQNIFSVNLEFDYRPIEPLTLSLGVSGRFVTDFASVEGHSIAGGIPPVDGFVKLRYNHRKFSAGVHVRICAPTEWSSLEHTDEAGMQPPVMKSLWVPFYADAGLDVEWHVKENCSVFVEGTNLANMKIYNVAFYREQGIRFTAGVKFTF